MKLNNPFQIKNIIPDYSKGVSFSSNPYIAPSSGLVVCWNAGGNNADAQIIVNGQGVGHNRSGHSYSEGSRQSCSALVCKGDNVAATGGTRTFYPLRGA